MKLHGNAALSWTGRRRLAERVVVEGWTLTPAAAAAGVSVRCARKWVGRYPLEGPAGLARSLLAAAALANRTPEDRVRLIAAMRRLRLTAAEISEPLGMALSTVSGILTRLGLGRLGRLGLEQPLRCERSRPGELVHIDVKRLGRIEGGADKGAFASERRQRYNPAPSDLEGQAPPPGRLRIRARLRRRLQSSDLRGGPLRRTGRDSRRLPAPRARLLPSPRDQGRAPPDRQRRRLRLRPARARLPQARHQAQPDPSLPAPDKRQSRALHPHPRCGLGLRRDLPLKPGTHRRP
jgi:transposase